MDIPPNNQRTLDDNGDAVAPVLIVDDHSLLAGSLAMVLAAEGCAVRTLRATTVEQLRDELTERPATVVLVRIQPGPRLSGALRLVEIASGLRANVAVLSDSTHELLFAAAVEAGAAGMVGTSELMADMVDQILAMVKGEQLLTEDRRRELLDLYRGHRVDRDSRFMPFESLSRRENEVLLLLMEGHSVAKIAESSFVSVGTVRTQVKAILRKLGVNSQAAAVALAYRSGWASADPSLPVDLRLPRGPRHG